jgi:hypothetical protein
MRPFSLTHFSLLSLPLFQPLTAIFAKSANPACHSSTEELTQTMSISDKQLAANRANAQKSTGPKTEAGKTRSSMNGRKHGFTGHATITTEEDYEAWKEFSVPYVADLRPVGAVETQLARTIALDNFRLNRLKAVEENTFSNGETLQACDFEAEDHRIHHAIAQAKVFRIEGKTFHNLSLYEVRLNRVIHKNLRLLYEIQARRKAEERLEAKTKPLTRSASGATEQNGFDFSSALSKAKTAPETPKGAEPGIKKAA